MNRAALLGGTAIAAVMAYTPAMAGSLGTGDNLEVTLEGEVRVSVAAVDQDDREGAGRGYRFVTDESEIKLEARNTADAFGHPFLYGVQIVLNTNTDDLEALLVEVESMPDDVGVAAEAALPQPPREDRHLAAPGRAVRLRESASDDRFCAQHLQQVGCGLPHCIPYGAGSPVDQRR